MHSVPDARSAPTAAPEFKKKPEDVEISEFEDITLKATVAGMYRTQRTSSS